MSDVPSRIAYSIAHSQRFVCAYCGHTMTLKRNRPNSMTIEHMMPLSRGGTSRRSNLVAACWACNHRKGEMTLAEFAAVYGVRIGDAA